MKNVLFVALTMLIAFSSCQNEGNTDGTASKGSTIVKPDPTVPFDSVAHAKMMEENRKVAEANTISEDNFKTKGGAGAMVVGSVENSANDKNEGLINAAISFLGTKSIGISMDNGYYGYNLTDLNGDGIADALMYLTGSNFCEDGKCTVLVAKGEAGGKFTFHSMIQFISLPVLVSEFSTKGWRDIVTQVFDSENTATTVKLAFNGTKYPDGPMAKGVKPTDKPFKSSGFLMNSGNTGLNLAY